MYYLQDSQKMYNIWNVDSERYRRKYSKIFENENEFFYFNLRKLRVAEEFWM